MGFEVSVRRHPRRMHSHVRKEKMPAEHLRRVIRTSKSTSPTFMGAMRYLPHAVHNLLRSMPMPWESIRYVDVVYHVSGLITFVTDRRRVSVGEYRRRWSEASERFNKEASRRGGIRELRYPVFDDDDEIVDYGSIMGLPVPRAIGCSGSGPDVFPSVGEEYLYNWRSFLISRRIGMQLDNGPYVKPRSVGEVCVMGREPGHERVTYPYLYNVDVDVPVLERQNVDIVGGGMSMGSKRKGRHPVDIPLMKGWYLSSQPGGPRVGALLRRHGRKMENGSQGQAPSGIIKELRNTRYFLRTEIDWVEAGLQLVYQGHRMLSEILRRKKLSYLSVDGNFNLRPMRALTTKERKKSRVGTSFHLTRELLKLVKHVVDVHVVFRQGNIDSYELMKNVGHVFNNVGIVTGMYRYKYRVMRQIKQCKELRRVGEYKDTRIWAEQWRVWVFMVRGHIPLLGRYIGGLVARMSLGRRYDAKPVSKQRSESSYDVALKRRIVGEVSSILERGQTKRLLQHFGEAWRCWKANIPYHIVYEQMKSLEMSRDSAAGVKRNAGVSGLGEMTSVCSTVDVRRMVEMRERFVTTEGPSGFSMELGSRGSGEVQDQDVLVELQRIIDKYVGLKAEWYIRSAIGDGEGGKMRKKRIGKITRLYMKEEMGRQREYLRSPGLKAPEAVAIYRLCADYFKNKKVRKIMFPSKNEDKFLGIAVDRLKGAATAEEAEFFDRAVHNGAETIFKMKRAILTQRTFKDVGVVLRSGGGDAVRSYDVSYAERLTDSFLCTYLFYEADKLGLFPEFIKPGDEVDMRLLMDFCEGVSEFDVGDRDIGVLYEGEYKGLMENVDNNLLCKLLKLVMEPALADYIISRNNCHVCYKDMSYVNHVGFIKGFQLSSFVYKFYTFVVDLCVLGSDFFMDERSSVKLYLRHMDRMYVLFRFRPEELDALVKSYEGEVEMMRELGMGPQTNCFDDVVEGRSKRDSERSREVGSAVHVEMATRLLPSLGRIEFVGYSVFPRIKFSMCGVDVMVCDSRIHERSSWRLRNGRYANLGVSKEGVEWFKNRISHIIETSGSATFLKVANRWNTSILGFVAYYRESIADTPGLMSDLRRAEDLMQNVIKKGINSKMPVRFPPAMFYSPREFGGLGMLSMGDIEVPLEDTGEGESRRIPSLVEYIERWDVEFKESDRVWMEYGRSGKMEPEKGIPRMSTLLQKDKTMFYDRGFRMVNRYRRYSSLKPDPFGFTSVKHDGRLWSIERFTVDTLEELGGIGNISKHTLFGATYFRTFNKVFWEDTIVEKYKRLTNAQRMGMNQIPNRRFILWWSPTINRGNVYVGYQVQLEQTGILMHGKLPTLKVSFVQIFRGHLWRKIHESVVADLCDAFRRHCDVRRMEVHSKKSYRFGSSSADIVLCGNFYVHLPGSSLDSEGGDGSDVRNCKELWVDVQLRWGDYDKRDTDKYAKVRFTECVTDPLTRYPTDKGFVVALDLCYNTFSVYGNLSRELRLVLNTSMERIITDNVTLHILRERLRKALQLYTSDVETVSNGVELFNCGLLVDSRLLLKKQRLLLVFDPSNGNLYVKSCGMENKKPRHIRSVAAQEVFSLGEGLNKRSIAVTDDMVDAMENFVIDHPSITIRSTGSTIPFSNVLKIEDFVVKKDPVCVDVYKGWNGTSKFTNFCRLLLVIQGLGVDEERVRELGICRMWPGFSDDEWIEREIGLKDLIVGDYCSTNNVDPDTLSQNEIRDIVFGFKIHGSLEERVMPREKSISRAGPVLSGVSFEEGSSWRTRYVELDGRIGTGEYEAHVSGMVGRMCATQLCDGETDGGLEIPLNLVEEFALLVDPRVLVCGLILNTMPVSFGLPPQFSSECEIHSASFVPSGVDVIGVVINGERMDVADVLARRYGIHNPVAIIICNGVKVMRRGDTWDEAPFAVSRRPGVFYVPEMWNYNFSKPFYDDGLVYTLRIGTPCRFYDGFSRIGHFSKFWCDGEEDEDSEMY